MKQPARQAAVMGLLLAIACAISYLEGLLPIPLPLGVKPGLASIVVMYALLERGSRDAVILTVLKSGFVLLTRGVTASLLSLSGGLLSLLVMLLAAKCLHSSLVSMSIAGGIVHNLAQLGAAAVLLHTSKIAYYFPVLLVAGCIAGGFTGGCLCALLPKLRAAGGHTDP